MTSCFREMSFSLEFHSQTNYQSSESVALNHFQACKDSKRLSALKLFVRRQSGVLVIALDEYLCYIICTHTCCVSLGSIARNNTAY